MPSVVTEPNILGCRGLVRSIIWRAEPDQAPFPQQICSGPAMPRCRHHSNAGTACDSRSSRCPTICQTDHLPDGRLTGRAIYRTGCSRRLDIRRRDVTRFGACTRTAGASRAVDRIPWLPTKSRSVAGDLFLDRGDGRSGVRLGSKADLLPGAARGAPTPPPLQPAGTARTRGRFRRRTGSPSGFQPPEPVPVRGAHGRSGTRTGPG